MGRGEKATEFGFIDVWRKFGTIQYDIEPCVCPNQETVSVCAWSIEMGMHEICLLSSQWTLVYLSDGIQEHFGLCIDNCGTLFIGRKW